MPPTRPLAGAADAARQEAARAWIDFVRPYATPEALRYCEAAIERSAVGTSVELAGPVGERNVYTLEPRGRVLCLAASTPTMIAQVGAALATGNAALVVPPPDPNNFLIRLPPALRVRVQRLGDPREAPCDLVLYEGDADDLLHWQRVFADLPGPVVPFLALRRGAPLDGSADFDLAWLVRERAVSTNTAAAGGNASLMSIG